MIDCENCGFYDWDVEQCTCPSMDMWYACPIENKKPENIKALSDYCAVSSYNVIADIDSPKISKMKGK